MGERKTVFLVVVFSLCLLTSSITVVFASLGTWVEVARFTETEQGSNRTETFECSHVDWIIRWSFSSSINEPQLMFSITVYNSSGRIVDFFVTASGKSGILNYNTTGSFYLLIGELYVQNYEIIVEQNIDSIPEFPSWIILPLFLTATMIGILVRRRLARTRISVS